jgi:hypothetical protein
MYCL